MEPHQHSLTLLKTTSTSKFHTRAIWYRVEQEANQTMTSFEGKRFLKRLQYCIEQAICFICVSREPLAVLYLCWLKLFVLFSAIILNPNYPKTIRFSETIICLTNRINLVLSFQSLLQDPYLFCHRTKLQLKFYCTKSAASHITCFINPKMWLTVAIPLVVIHSKIHGR